MPANFIKIRLSKGTWSYDRDGLLGEGGLGVVFAGIGLNGESVAIKQINLTAPNIANRETLIAESLLHANYQYIVPILDAGVDLDTDLCYIVMPRAVYNLKAYIAEFGPLSETETLSILRQIAAGLAEVSSTIVHRDLKPDNILFHGNVWKIADFGIARFVEQATASRTVKDYFTPQYAAPEQWRKEHATTATDIYALGCIAYELLSGQPPFPGPSDEDYADQHSHTTPSPLPGTISASLRELISLMLRKPMNSRPDLLRVIQRIAHCINHQSNLHPHQQGHYALASIGAQIAQDEAWKESLQAQQRAEQQHRSELASTANLILTQVVDRFADYLQGSSSQIRIFFEGANAGRAFAAGLGDASLFLRPPTFTFTRADNTQSQIPGPYLPPDGFAYSKWVVVAGVTIEIQAQKVICGANLWYMSWGNQSSYRWYEAGYDYTNPIDRTYAPIYLRSLRDADLAAAPGVSKYTMLSQPQPIDDEDIDTFYDRWASMLALIAKGDYDATRDTYRRLIAQK